MFNDKNRYLTASEQRKLAAFLALDVQCKTVVTNPKGEQRRVIMVKYPKGCVTKDTVWGPPKEDNSRDYHTPVACLEDVRAWVYYEDKATGEKLSTHSDEWVKWAGKSHTVDVAVKGEGNKELDAYVATLKNVSKKPPKKMTGGEYDQYSKEAKWIRLKDGSEA